MGGYNIPKQMPKGGNIKYAGDDNEKIKYKEKHEKERERLGLNEDNKNKKNLRNSFRELLESGLSREEAVKKLAEDPVIQEQFKRITDIGISLSTFITNQCVRIASPIKSSRSKEDDDGR